MEPHTVSRLIGAPPGYVGFDQGGLLTDAIMQTPYAVLVLDEIEKAHPEPLQHPASGDGPRDAHRQQRQARPTSGNVILIMTTNAGRARSCRRGASASATTSSRGKGRGAIERTFSPEFRNRLDAWIAFDPLARGHRAHRRQVHRRARGAARREERADRADAGGARLARRARLRPTFGARPMARLIQNELKEPLVDAILFGDLPTAARWGWMWRRAARRSASS